MNPTKTNLMTAREWVRWLCEQHVLNDSTAETVTVELDAAIGRAA